MVFGEVLAVLVAYDPEDERQKEPLLAQKAIEFAVRSEPKKASYLMSNAWATALSGAQSPYVKKRPVVSKVQKQRSREKETLQPKQMDEVMLSVSEKHANEAECGDCLKILPEPKPEFKKINPKNFTVDVAKRKPYETEYTDAIEFAGEEPK